MWSVSCPQSAGGFCGHCGQDRGSCVWCSALPGLPHPQHRGHHGERGRNCSCSSWAARLVCGRCKRAQEAKIVKNQVGNRWVYLPGCIHENKRAVPLLSLSAGGRGGPMMLTLISLMVVSYRTAVTDTVWTPSKEQRRDPLV